MSVSNARTCRKCGYSFALDSYNFGHMPNGNLGWTCRECKRKIWRAHHKRNPEKLYQRVARRKIQEARADGHSDPDDIQRIRILQHNECFYCGDPLGPNCEVDHKVPVSRGGSHWRQNLALACSFCNKQKHNKTADEFIELRRSRGEKLNVWRLYNRLTTEEKKQLQLKDFDFTDRTANALREIGLVYVNDLIKKTKSELFADLASHSRSVTELRRTLGDLGLKLKGE